MRLRDGDTPGLARGRRRLAVAVALGVALLAQGAWSFAVRPEPYPAVRMPSFEGAADPSGRFAATTLDITIEYADGSRTSPGVRALMTGFRDTATRRSADHVFAPAENRTAPRPVDDPEVRSWLRDRARALGPGSEPTAVEFCWRRGAVDIRTAAYVDLPACTLMRVEL